MFALLLLINGIAFGLFAAPNTTGIMNSVPSHDRGAASGMSATFRNSGMVLSIGLFFSLMIIGLASTLPHTLYTGLVGQGLDAKTASGISHLPPVALLFAAFLGYNPMKTLLGPKLTTLSAKAQANVDGTQLLPAPHLRTVHARPADRVHNVAPDVSGRRGMLCVARRQGRQR